MIFIGLSCVTRTLPFLTSFVNGQQLPLVNPRNLQMVIEFLEYSIDRPLRDQIVITTSLWRDFYRSFLCYSHFALFDSGFVNGQQLPFVNPRNLQMVIEFLEYSIDRPLRDQIVITTSL